VDAPPGTSCPVITAIRDTDFVVLVTEPTPFGLHDLKLAVEVIKVLKIPAGLIINRANLGDGAVKEYAEKEDIPILMEIPFDRKIAELYAKGKIISEEQGHWRAEFCSLYETIRNRIEQGQELRA
jgi:MinD superfamily P-loop ATPase